jgi:hypothetical protein
LIGGLGFATWFWHQEREARKQAVAAEQQALAAEQQQAKLRMEAEDRERITQAAFLISQGKIEEADQVVEKVSELEPSLEAESVLRSLGDWHALKGQWAQAAERFNLLLEADQKDNSWMITEDLLKAGPILIERGDMQNYERFRRAAIARYAGTTNPVFAERTLKISLLLPGDAQLMKLLEPFSDVSAGSMQGPVDTNDIMAAWRCISLGIIAYRQGYTPTAIAWSKRALLCADQNPPRMATAHIIQAMSCYQLNEVQEARSELESGRKLVEAEFASGLQPGNGAIGFWYDWLYARILLREAEALIEKTPSAGK